MAKNIGTLVIATVRPYDSADTYPVAKAEEVSFTPAGGLVSTKVQDAILEAAFIFSTAIEITYAELVTLISNSQLIPNQKYRITDFQSRHLIPETTDYNDNISMDFDISVIDVTSSTVLSIPLGYITQIKIGDTIVRAGSDSDDGSYLVTDVYYGTDTSITCSSANWSLSGNFGTVQWTNPHTLEVEPIIITAASTNTLELVAHSDLYPLDVIHYDVNGYEEGATKGSIIYRKAPALLLIEAHENWRNKKYRRWNTMLDGTGDFTVLSSNGNPYIDIPMIDIVSHVQNDVSQTYRISIGTPRFPQQSTFQTNIIISADCIDITIDNDNFNETIGIGCSIVSFGESGNDYLLKGANSFIYIGCCCDPFTVENGYGDITLGNGCSNCSLSASAISIGENSPNWTIGYSNVYIAPLMDGNGVSITQNNVRIGGGLVPSGGSTGDVLIKNSATNYDIVWQAPGVGSGDVVGPASAVDSNFAAFDTTTGKLIKDSGSKAADFAVSGHNHSGVYAPVTHAATHVTGGGDTIADAIAAGNSGLMSGADKTKLDGIASGATAYTDTMAKDAVGGIVDNSLVYVSASSLGVAQATDALAGKIEIATNAEVITGTDSSRAVTPAGGAATYLYKNISAMPAVNQTAQGPTINALNASGTITLMNLCYLNGSSAWALADANAASSSSGLLGLSLESKTVGQAMSVALPGSVVRNDTWNWTPGQILYVDTTAGAITATQPSGVDDVIRVIGFALTADVIYFNPSADYITHT